jgi:predicted TIM-barrel fold metal-dependent hydrolase
LPKIAELGWQIEVHCEAERLRRVVGPLIERSQNAIAIVVDHFGRPDPLLGIDDPGFRYLLTLGATRRVWVKVSGAYRNGTELGARSGESIAHAAMPLLIAAFGLDRLVWGSDWPHTQFEHRTSFGAAHRLLLELLPSKDAQQKVLVDTAAQLFKIGGSRPLWQGSACLR